MSWLLFVPPGAVSGRGSHPRCSAAGYEGRQRAVARGECTGGGGHERCGGALCHYFCCVPTNTTTSRDDQQGIMATYMVMYVCTTFCCLP